MALPLDHRCRRCMVAVSLEPREYDGLYAIFSIGTGSKDDLTKPTAYHVPISFGSWNSHHLDRMRLLASKTENCLSLVRRVHQVAIAGTTAALANPDARIGYLGWTYCKQGGLALIFQRFELQVLV